MITRRFPSCTPWGFASVDVWLLVVVVVLLLLLLLLPVVAEKNANRALPLFTGDRKKECSKKRDGLRESVCICVCVCARGFGQRISKFFHTSWLAVCATRSNGSEPLEEAYRPFTFMEMKLNVDTHTHTHTETVLLSYNSAGNKAPSVSV